MIFMRSTCLKIIWAAKILIFTLVFSLLFVAVKDYEFFVKLEELQLSDEKKLRKIDAKVFYLLPYVFYLKNICSEMERESFFSLVEHFSIKIKDVFTSPPELG